MWMVYEADFACAPLNSVLKYEWAKYSLGEKHILRRDNIVGRVVSSHTSDQSLIPWILYGPLSAPGVISEHS